MGEESASAMPGGETLLLQSMLSYQRDMANDLRVAVSKMATKGDLAALTEALKITVSQRELDAFKEMMNVKFVAVSDRFAASEAAVKALADATADAKSNKMPAWFWPTMLGVAAVVVPVLQAILSAIVASKVHQVGG